MARLLRWDQTRQWSHRIHFGVSTPRSPEGALTVQGQSLMPAPPGDLQLIVLSNLAKGIRQFGEAAPINQPQAEAILGPVPMFQEAIVGGAPVKLAPEANQVGIQPLAIAAVPQEGLKVDRLMAEINNVGGMA